MKDNLFVPYEINGKIGCVDQKLENVTETKYKSLLSVSKHCAVALTDDNKYAVISPFGQETAISLPLGLYISLIGDEHYAIPEEVPKETGHWLKTVIYSVFSDEKYVVYDL